MKNLQSIHVGGNQLSSESDVRAEDLVETPETVEATATTETPEGTEAVEATEAAGDVSGSETETVEAAESTDSQTAEADKADAAARKHEILTAIAEHVRADSSQVVLTDPAVFSGEPFLMSEDDLDETWAEMAESEEFRDIVRTKDEKSGITYVHSEALLTVPYAKLMLRTAANDPVYLIVETVRDESRIYPRPTAASFFEFEPFNLVLEDVLEHVETILATEAYSDIKVVHPSNGATYLFSERYLDEARALPMAQWVEVDVNLPSNQ